VLKGSSLGAAIAYPEIASVLLGTVNNLVGQPVVIMTITLLLYLGFSSLIAAALQLYLWRKARWR
jgi:general L-amino acid transport system permease protein